MLKQSLDRFKRLFNSFVSSVKPDSAVPSLIDSGNSARERLLSAALELFGEHGWHGTSVRDIARAAGLNVALISYHFGGKEQLYQELLRTMMGRILHKEEIAAVMKEISQWDGIPLPPAEAKKLLSMLLRAMLLAQLNTRKTLLVVRIIVREQTQPTSGFEILYQGGMELMHKTVTRLAAAAMGANPVAHEAILRAHMLMGQVLSFTFARTAICRRLGRTDGTLSAKSIATAIQVLEQNIEAICNLPVTAESSALPSS